MKLVYLDTETTSLKPGQIAQISYLIEEDNRLVKAYNSYFTVDSMDLGASNCTGLTVDKCKVLSGGLVFGDKADEIYEDLSSAYIIGHNIQFDIKFIREEFLRVGKFLEVVDSIDTMHIMKDITKIPRNGGRYKYPKLDEALRFANITSIDMGKYLELIYGISTSAHDSRYDAVAVYLLTYKLRQAGIIAV